MRKRRDVPSVRNDYELVHDYSEYGFYVMCSITLCNDAGIYYIKKD